MESSGSHNTGAANLIDDLYASIGMKTPGQDYYSSETVKTVTCIKGHPCIIFFSPTGDDYEYIGKYNLNLDKATPEPFGFMNDTDIDYIPKIVKDEKDPSKDELMVSKPKFNKQQNSLDIIPTIKIREKDKDGNDIIKELNEKQALELWNKTKFGYLLNKNEQLEIVNDEKLNAIYCFEFLDNAVKVCNFLAEEGAPSTQDYYYAPYVILTEHKEDCLGKNLLYLDNGEYKSYDDIYNEDIFDYDDEGNVTNPLTLYKLTEFTKDAYWHTWYDKYDAENFGWTKGFESRYPED
jgi:hypothetical protein